MTDTKTAAPPAPTDEAKPVARLTLQDLTAKQDAVRADLLALESKDDITAEDEQFQDSLLQTYDELEAQRVPLAARMARIDRVRYAADDTDNTEAGDKPAPVRRGGSGPDVFARHRRDPFSDETQKLVRSALLPKQEIRGMALDVIERAASRGLFSQDAAEIATQRTQMELRWPSTKAGEENLAQHILTTGSDEYYEAFMDYLSDPQGRGAQRAALSLTLANGGYMLPFVLDPTIILTNAGSANPWRRIAANKTTTSNTWNGVTSAGVSAAWLAEGTESTDNTPTVGNIVITPQKAAAWVFGSYEVLADTDFAQQLPELLADARDRLEEAAFATGTGTGQPQGVLTGSTTTVNTATTLAYAIADVYALQQNVPARFRNSAKFGWVMNVAFINKTRQFDTAGGASFWTNLGKGQPETLLGAPIYESTTMFGGTQAIGSLMAVAGDFGQYIVVDRVGVSLMYEPMVKGTANARPTGQAGWFMFWRTGAAVAVPNAFRVLRGL